MGLLGEPGATWSRWGERLIPIATIYDPYVARALDAARSGSTPGARRSSSAPPSGVTLAPEGVAHQSTTTPSIGLEQPACVAWEPAFGQDLEWCLLHAMDRVGVPGGTSSYFRLSTRTLDQGLARLPDDPVLLERRRRQAVAGGYRLTDHDPATEQVTLVGVGAVLPEVLGAAELLAQQDVTAGVVCLTRPDLVFRSFQHRGSRGSPGGDVLDLLLPDGDPDAVGYGAGRASAHALVPPRGAGGTDPLPARERVRSVVGPAGRLRAPRAGRRRDRRRGPGAARTLSRRGRPCAQAAALTRRGRPAATPTSVCARTAASSSARPGAQPSVASCSRPTASGPLAASR